VLMCEQYVGRWTTAPNRLRIDGAFPGQSFAILQCKSVND